MKYCFWYSKLKYPVGVALMKRSFSSWRIKPEAVDIATMQGGSSGIGYGLKYKARCIADVKADTSHTTFITGTLSLKGENEDSLQHLHFLESWPSWIPLVPSSTSCRYQVNRACVLEEDYQLIEICSGLEQKRI